MTTIEPPQHVAIIMDGNGRWAECHGRSRQEGHRRGMRTARRVVAAAGERGIRYLTLFAFSSENWNRPPTEVSALMSLFFEGLNRHGSELLQEGVRVRFLGDKSLFPKKLCDLMIRTEERTMNNDKLNLAIAVGYGGRWDVVDAVRRMAARGDDLKNLSEHQLSLGMSGGYAPDPDLLIRTGGELRLSNFLLWQLAYAELYFTPVLWPDFDEEHLDEALETYMRRERRFGESTLKIRQLG